MTETEIYEKLGTINDPEIPVLSIIDLGIVRDVRIPDEDTIEVDITPTYSGCPAMDLLHAQIRLELEALGYTDVTVREVLSPAWTTDWMSASGKEKLEAYGIAPPRLRSQKVEVHCPRCKSKDVKLVSEFGSTSCKALYQCNACSEPFDYFKCI